MTERRDLVARFVVVAAVAAFLGGIAGWQIAQPESEQFNAVDVGFLADMTTHHQGALSLSFDYLGRESDPVVGHFAREIVREQSVEIATMNALLNDVGAQADATVDDDVAMEWMGEAVAPAAMPGLASAADFARLQAATGLAADDVFTELMIAHHAAGAEMASYAAEHGENETVRRLARGMARVQRLEIDELNERRRVLGLPEITATHGH